MEDLNEDTYIPFVCESENHTIYVNEVYHDDESYYWCFHYAQAMDGIKIVHDAVGVYHEDSPYLPKVEIILKDNELYFFSAILVEKVKSIHDYEKIISLDGAIQIIADQSNLLFETGQKYMRGNGQVL